MLTMFFNFHEQDKRLALRAVLDAYAQNNLDTEVVSPFFAEGTTYRPIHVGSGNELEESSFIQLVASDATRPVARKLVDDVAQFVAHAVNASVAVYLTAGSTTYAAVTDQDDNLQSF